MPKKKNDRHPVGAGDDTIHITFPLITNNGSPNGTFKCFAVCHRWVTEKNPEGRVRLSTGIRIPVEQWDKNKNEIRKTYKPRESILGLLNGLVERIRQAYIIADSNRIGTTHRACLSVDDLKSVVEGKAEFRLHGSLPLFVRNHAIKDDQEFGGLFGEFMRRYLTKNGSKISELESSYKNFRNLAYNLELFLNAYFPFGFTAQRFQNELPEFSKMWFRFLIKDEDTASSTINGLTKRLAQILRWAMEENYIPVLSLKCLRFAHNPYPQISLSQQSLSALFNFKFTPSQKRLERARDLFVLMCLTSLRFSNIWNLNAALQVEGEALHVETIKDKGTVIVPMFPATRSILDKYKEGLPRISNQKFNEYIKEACVAAGLNESVIVKQQRGDRTEQRTYKLFEVVAAHTGRRTFVSICRALGVKEHIIMKVTGHKNLAQLNTYTNIPDVEVLYAFGKARETAVVYDPMFSISEQWMQAA